MRITSDFDVAERSTHGRLSMQRFRLLGFYLVGVVAVIGLAVWGISLRRTGADAQPPSDARASQDSPTTATTRAAVKVSINNFDFGRNGFDAPPYFWGIFIWINWYR